MGAPRFFRGRRFLVETSKVEQVTVVSEDGSSVVPVLNAALFPGTTYTDRGMHDFDLFPLNSVPLKRNNTIIQRQ